MTVANVAEVDGDLILDRFNIEQIGAVRGNHGIDKRDLGAQANELDGKIGPDETEPSRDQDVGAIEGFGGNFRPHATPPLRSRRPYRRFQLYRRMTNPH